MMANRTDERGVAVVAAVFALLLMGGLIAGAFFVGMQEQRVGRNTVKIQQAFNTADAAAEYLLADWDAFRYNNIAAGSTLTDKGWTDDGTGWYRRTLRRMNTMLYLVDAQGFSADSSTHQHVGVLARLRPFEIDIDAAFKTKGAVRVRGNSDIDGHDHLPPGWSGCPPLGASLPGILVDDVSNVRTSGNSYEIDGAPPPVRGDATIDEAALTTFGDDNFDALAAIATMALGPGTYTQIQPSFVGTQCNLADPQNWGDGQDPSSPCGKYFPTIYISGDARINGRQGQGLLLVDGDLSVAGNFEFFGVVIVRGRFKTTGTGQKFNGAVIAANGFDDENDIGGNAQFLYSSCAVQQSLQGTAFAIPLGERSWMHLY
jgi:hypothetical protein